jgi:hypothetical protein
MRKFLRLGVAVAVFGIVYPDFAATVSRPSAPSARVIPSAPPQARPTPQLPSGGIARAPTPTPQAQNPTGVNRPVIAPPASPLPSGGRPVAAAPNSPAGGVSRPAIAPGTPSPRPVAAAPSAIDTRMTQGHSQASLNSFRADQNRFSKPPVLIPQNRQAALQSPVMRQYGSRWGNADQYYAARNSSLGRMSPAYQSYYNNPPRYVTNIRPAYGSFSTPFLCGLIGVGVGVVIIDHSNAMWAYSHRTDPAYMAWHYDMMEQAANDPELNTRMMAFNGEITVMETNGVQAEPNQLPDGVDPSLVVAPETVLMATSEEAPAPQEAPVIHGGAIEEPN